MPSVDEMLRDGARRLPGAETRNEVALLLAHVLGASRSWLVAHADDAVEPDRVAAFQALVERRACGEPVAYLAGGRGFHAIELALTPDVLIPRPETELLVDLALERIPPETAFALADLGTGSGAVALAIARARPLAHVVATDISAAALAVARANAVRLGLRGVEFAEGNWCGALGTRRFDLVVSNPPYIARGDPHLASGDLRFEPMGALVSGEDGLDAIRCIVGDATMHLQPGSWLLLEHGFAQGKQVRGLLARHGYAAVFSARDLEGRERVSGGRTA